MGVHLTNHPLGLLVVDNAHSSAFHYDREMHRIYGCIYDRHNRRVDSGIRVGGFGGDVIINADPEYVDTRSPSSCHYSGTTLYLGNLMGQFGHFITEGLSTFWALPITNVDRVFFHPFIFGGEVPAFMKPIHSVFGLDDIDVVVSREPCTFDRIIVPERTIILNKSGHIEHRQTMRRIVSACSSSYGKSPTRLIFVSRSKIQSDKRAFTNTGDVDAVAASLGFEIVHPQLMDIRSQIQLFSETKILAGSSGSGLHNCLFQAPGSLVIEIGSARLPNAPHPMQTLCNGLAGVESFHIPYKVCEQFNADLGHLKSALAKSLKEADDVVLRKAHFDTSASLWQLGEQNAQ